MDLSASTQLLHRNLDDLQGRRILLVDSPAAEAAGFLRESNPDAHLTAAQSHHGDYRAACDHSAGAIDRVCFTADIPKAADGDGYDLAIVHHPKGRDRREMLLALTGAKLHPNGRLLLVGPVRTGIRSARKTLDRLFARVEKRDAARHCALLEAASFRGDAEWPPVLAEWRRVYPIDVAGISVEVASYPGVFSHHRLDDGTRLLLETVEVPENGRLLDFGCGCGVIGAVLQTRSPQATVHLVDTSALAIAAAKETAACNGIAAENVFPSDILTSVPDRYEAIVSNPPFHAGVKTDYTVAERFLHAAADRLTPHGRLTVVANRFLRYQPLIESAVGPVRILADDGRYRVYQARRAAT